MPRPKNDKRRQQIRKMYEELQPLRITQVATIREIAARLRLSEHTIMYYLRGAKVSVSRPKIPDFVRNVVVTMELPEIKEYAKRVGRSWKRLYQLALDARKRPITPPSEKRKTEIVTVYKEFNFGSIADLHCFGFTLDTVREAKRVLRKFNLTLVAPNQLVAPKNGKTYRMDFNEQAMILTKTEWFVTTYAWKIGENWKPYKDAESVVDTLGLD